MRLLTIVLAVIVSTYAVYLAVSTVKSLTMLQNLNKMQNEMDLGDY